MRLPIRLRLTAWHAILLAAIIVALSAFLVLQLRADLKATIDREVRTHAAELAWVYAHEGAQDLRDDWLEVGRTALPAGDGGVAQVLDRTGRVIIAESELGRSKPIAPADARAAALAGRPRMLTVALGPRQERYRAIVSPVGRRGRPGVLVVAETLHGVEQSVERVLVLLLLATPAALAATAVAGWWLIRRALLPVEQMTVEAEAIEIDRINERIAMPRAADEIGHLAATLNAMLDRLEEGVKEKHRLISDASHELRTPLAVMRAELDVSLRGDDLSPDARAVLESAREEVGSMSHTVDNLLTLAQIDEGRLELLTTRIALGEAIEAAARPLRPLAAAKNVRLDISGDAGEAQADPERLRQAIANLIENAIKFTKPGGEVRVNAWRRGDEVGVTVADDGPGIPADARAHVFERFYRVDHARGRDAGGSGLGLAICREIASAHHGRVWVESEEGKGSAFSLALAVRGAAERARPSRGHLSGSLGGR
jgi:two-component system OmpR family sensor kinase